MNDIDYKAELEEMKILAAEHQKELEQDKRFADKICLKCPRCGKFVMSDCDENGISVLSDEITNNVVRCPICGAFMREVE